MSADDELLDTGYPEIRADAIADIYFVGDDVHVVYFCWKKIDGVMRRCIAGEVIRPTTSYSPEYLAVLRQRYAASQRSESGSLPH